MRILIVSGIWPPDVGGPASHAPEIADALAARGHAVEVVTTASAPPEPRHIRSGMCRARCPPAFATPRSPRSSRGVPAQSTSSMRRAWWGGRRSRLVLRSSSRWPAIRHMSDRCDSGSTLAPRRVPEGAARPQGRPPARGGAPPRCGVRRASSARAASCAGIVLSWGSPRPRLRAPECGATRAGASAA